MVKSLEEIAEELEGKRFVFRWTDHDPDYEGSCLAVFRFEDGDLRGEMGFDRYAEEMESYGLEISEEIADDLRRSGVKEVYSVVNSPRKVFGLEKYHDNSEVVDESGAIDEWCELEPICIDDEEYELLQEEGITVRFLDYDGRAVLD